MENSSSYMDSYLSYYYNFTCSNVYNGGHWASQNGDIGPVITEHTGPNA